MKTVRRMCDVDASMYPICYFLSRSLFIDLVNIWDSVKSKPLMRILVSNVRLYLLYAVFSCSCGRVSRMSTFGYASQQFSATKQAVYVSRHIQVVNCSRSIIIARYCSTSALNVVLNAIAYHCIQHFFKPGPRTRDTSSHTNEGEQRSRVESVWYMKLGHLYRGVHLCLFHSNLIRSKCIAGSRVRAF